MKYEYKVVNTGFASLEDTIHAHAADGWRVVACPNYSNILKLILEREVNPYLSEGYIQYLEAQGQMKLEVSNGE